MGVARSMIIIQNAKFIYIPSLKVSFYSNFKYTRITGYLKVLSGESFGKEKSCFVKSSFN